MLRRFFKVTTFFLLSLTTLHSEDFSANHHITTTLAGLPDGKVDNCVNVITGNLHIPYTIMVRGAEPIQLHINYLSRSGKSDDGGWSIFSDLKAHLDINKTRISLTNHNGIPLRFTSSTDYSPDKGANFELADKTFQVGYTNSGTGELSGRYNIMSTRAVAKGKHLTVTLPDGRKREYLHDDKSYVWGDPIIEFLLTKEILPNGHQICYQYKKGKPRYIESFNHDRSQRYAYVEIEWKGGYDTPTEFIIKTSDKQSITFTKKTKDHNGETLYTYISGLESSHLVPQELHYYDKKTKNGCLLKQISQDDIKKTFEYVEKHHEKNGPRHGRVTKVFATRATPTTEFLHHIEYPHTGKAEKDAGDTIVKDAYGNITHYFFNKFFRLTRVEYHTANPTKKLSHTKEFKWNGCNLESKKIKDSKGVTLYSETIKYNGKQNPELLIRKGNLTGLGEGTYEIKRTFSDDGKNLLLSENEQNGKHIEYQYKDRTDLLKAKFVFNGEKIKIRHFYEYNKNNILEKEFIDDGSTKNPEDIDDITQRLITKRTLNETQQPFLGMPILIEEKYLDLSAKEERLLKKTKLTYDEQGNVEHTTVFDATGNECYTTTKHYNDNDLHDNGLLKYETNPLGQTAHYTYDQHRNLETETSFNNRVITNAYDKANRKTKVKTSAPDVEDLISQFAYDIYHNLSLERTHLGHETHHKYDAFQNPILTKYPEMVTASEETLSSTFEKVTPSVQAKYDCRGNLIESTDQNGHTTKTTYTAYNKPLQITHPGGSTEETYTETFTYYDDGKLHIYTDQEETRTTYEYDFLGRETKKIITSPDGELSSIEEKTYNSFHLITHTDAEKNTTTYVYDDAGRKICEKVENKDGEIVEQTEYTYDLLGRPYSTTIGSIITYTKYDYLDRVTEEWIEDPDGTLLSHVRYDYDDTANTKTITKMIQGQESKKTLKYDGYNRLKSETDALDYTTTYDYEEHYSTDLNTRLLKTIETSPRGVRTTTVHDTHDRPHITSVIDPHNQTISHQELYYDKAGNLTHTYSTPYLNTTPQEPILLFRNYDSLNRLSILTEAANTPYAKTTKYTYYPTGRLWTTKKPDKQTKLIYTYDFLGNPQTLHSSNTFGKAISYEFTHNMLGHLTSSTDLLTGAKTSRTLDHNGQILEETLANGLSISSTYDELGRKASLTYPDSSHVSYDYTPLYLSSITKTNSYGTVKYTHTFDEYDLSGNLLSETSISGKQTTYSYDALGRRISTSSPHFTQEIKEFDQNGNLIFLLTNNHSTEYTYDHLDQLTSESSPSAHDYTYDSLHNRHAIDADTYTINPLNQIDKTSSTTLEYDPNGNPEKINDTIYAYDALDRLIEIKTPKTIYKYTYDSFHRRITTTTLTVSPSGGHSHADTTHYFYDDQNELGATTQSVAIKQLRVLSATTDSKAPVTIALELSNANYTPLYTYTPINDLLGNLTAITYNNDLHEQYEFSAFGEEKASSTLNPWRFSSKRTDPTSLVYFGRRYYSPTLGRWLTPDPKGYTDGLNLYAYVYNSPLMNFDLYGLYSLNQSCWSQDLSYNSGLSAYAPSQETVTNYSNAFGKGIGDTLNTPRFQGGLVAFGGASEAALGMLAAGFPPFIPFAVLAMAQGMDYYTSGMQTVFTGQGQDPVAVHLLEKTGMSHATAHNVNNLTGILLTGFSGGVAKAVQAKSAIKSPSSSSSKTKSLIVKSEGNTTIYQAINSVTGEVEYVGITNNWIRRAAEHLKRGLDIQPIPGLESITRAEARAVEQTLIELYKLETNGGSLINKINSIAKTNPKYAEALKKGLEILKEIEYTQAQ